MNLITLIAFHTQVIERCQAAMAKYESLPERYAEMAGKCCLALTQRIESSKRAIAAFEAQMASEFDSELQDAIISIESYKGEDLPGLKNADRENVIKVAAALLSEEDSDEEKMVLIDMLLESQ